MRSTHSLTVISLVGGSRSRRSMLALPRDSESRGKSSPASYSPARAAWPTAPHSASGMEANWRSRVRSMGGTALITACDKSVRSPCRSGSALFLRRSIHQTALSRAGPCWRYQRFQEPLAKTDAPGSPEASSPGQSCPG